MKDLLRMDLQMFADENPGEEAGDEKKKDQENPPAEKPDESKKTYTDSDVDAIVNAKFAKWQKEMEQREADAARKAKLSEKERIQEEKSELEKKIQEFERKEVIREQAKVVSAKLDEAALPHDDELIELLATDNADETLTRLSVITEYVAKIKKNNTVAGTPKEGGQFHSDDKVQGKSLAARAKEKRIIK